MSDAALRNRYFDELLASPDLRWMGQNTNHLPAHPAVQQAMIEVIRREEYHLYAPPLGFESLRTAIAADLGVTGMTAIVTEGAVNALAMVCRARCRPGRRFVTTDPGWKWPCLLARRLGSEVVQIPIYDPTCNFRLSASALRKVVDERVAIIYLVDPNNPLGVCYSADEIAEFAAIGAEVGSLLLHDCTYRDFALSHTPAIAVAPDHAVVTLSFSKWLGLAGLRVGALAGVPALLDELVEEASAVLGASVLAQRAAEAGLRVKPEWMASVHAADSANKAMLIEAASAIPGLTFPVLPSHGNFLSMETVGAELRPEALVEAARRRGFMIRQGTYHTPRFGHRFVKISTSVPTAWMAAFCGALPALVKQARVLNDIPPQF